MKLSALSLLFLSLLFIACKKDGNEDPKLNASDSFLPMQIGNYWRMNAENYTEIQDTVRISKKLYYKFYSLVGGDAIAVSYLRIDKDNQLWESWPSSDGKEYLRAKFNANVNDTFFTLNDQTVNDYKVKMIQKTDDKRSFEFDMVYHPNLAGHPHTVTYIKGLGFPGAWNGLKIDGKVIK